jgi:hypothetical protein
VRRGRGIASKIYFQIVPLAKFFPTRDWGATIDTAQKLVFVGIHRARNSPITPYEIEQ